MKTSNEEDTQVIERPAQLERIRRIKRILKSETFISREKDATCWVIKETKERYEIIFIEKINPVNSRETTILLTLKGKLIAENTSYINSIRNGLQQQITDAARVEINDILGKIEETLS